MRPFSRCVLTALLSLMAAAPAAQAQKSGTVSLNPNRYKGSAANDPAPVAAPTAKRLNCDLTASEELLVTELRQALGQLQEREARVAAREAALRTFQAQIVNQLTELRRVQSRVTQGLVAQGTRAQAGEAAEKEAKAKAEAEAKAKAKQEQAAAEKMRKEQEKAALELEKAAAIEALGRRTADRKARTQQLAAILRKMKPAEAAPILSSQDLDVAIGVMELLGDRKAGKVLAKMDARRAVTLAKALIKRPVAQPEENE